MARHKNMIILWVDNILWKCAYFACLGNKKNWNEKARLLSYFSPNEKRNIRASNFWVMFPRMKHVKNGADSMLAVKAYVYTGYRPRGSPPGVFPFQSKNGFKFDSFPMKSENFLPFCLKSIFFIKDKSWLPPLLSPKCTRTVPPEAGPLFDVWVTGININIPIFLGLPSLLSHLWKSRWNCNVPDAPSSLKTSTVIEALWLPRIFVLQQVSKLRWRHFKASKKWAHTWRPF